ncbi:MAG TPA: C2 family cysteine protease [Pirellulales bacterium]|nr:C2 family cysteine protease [Pirellulales bacterium]
MAGLVPRSERTRRSQSQPKKSSRTRTPALRIEEVEPRLLLSGTPTPVHTPPTVVHAITLNGATSVTGRTASLSVLGNDAAGASKLVYDWSLTSEPAGGTATFSANGTNAAQNVTVTFNEAGTYGFTAKIVDPSGLSVSTTKTITVSQTLTSITITTSSHTTVSTGAPLHVTGTNQQLVAQGLDQFGKAMVTQPAFKWSTTTTAAGAASPTISASGVNATYTFNLAGTYGIKVASASNAALSDAATLIVGQTATSVAVTPGTASLAQGATQQFTAKAYDQFHNVMTAQPSFTWTATGGTITTGGLFTAGHTSGSYSVSAKTGSTSASATVTVQAASTFLGLQNATLGSLVQSLDADGSISRNDMIQILDSVSAKGAVTASEFSDLKTILGNATKLNMPGYVQVLAGDVINGNTANATYLGSTLGNLASGSSATQLNDLIGKWFLGTDLPTLSDPSYVYNTVSGSLFPRTPSTNDEFQGELGDCYFISSLGTIANSNPSAIENMIINNGDGTYTVRFYTGTYGQSYNSSTASWSDGFTSGTGTADYVTVNGKLPTTSSGALVYADYGASDKNSANSLWIPLLEKAYAEWDQTGKEGRSGQNSYASIEGGWMATVDAQVLGHNATDYGMTNSAEQYAINALAAHQAVTIGTAVANYGLVASHAYAILGYNASTGTFTLYNPWGFDQPGQLTWTQLEQTCDGFVVASTSGTTPIGGAPSQATLHSAAILNSTTAEAEATGTSTDASAAAIVPANTTTGGQSAAPFTATAASSTWDGDLTTQAIDAVFSGDSSPCEIDVPAALGLFG